MHPHVSTILLAAGKSSRMGCCKQLLPLGDRLVIDHCLSNIISAGIGEIIVVLGRVHEQLAAAVRRYPAAIVYNQTPDGDMASSVRAGMQALPKATTGVLICLADHPLVSSATYCSLLELHQRKPHKIIIPNHRGKRGHPALFPCTRLLELNGSLTLRDIVHSDPEGVVTLDTDDAGVVLDMDTPDDYRETVLACI